MREIFRILRQMREKSCATHKRAKFLACVHPYYPTMSSPLPASAYISGPPATSRRTVPGPMRWPPHCTAVAALWALGVLSAVAVSVRSAEWLTP